MIFAVIVLALYGWVMTCIALHQRHKCNVQHIYMNQMLRHYSNTFDQMITRTMERDQLAAENRDLREIESKRTEAERASEEGSNRIILDLDDLDHEAIKRVIAMRERSMPLPDGESNTDGAVLAEICRGYEEMLNAAGSERGEGDVG